MRLTLGEWLPDQPGVTGALTKAENVFSKAVGYGPFPAAADYSAAASENLTSLFAAKSSSSQVGVFAGAKTKIFKLDSDLTLDDVSKSGGYTTSDEQRWNFVQFGDTVYAANGNVALQSYTIGSSSLFADVTGAPSARYITTVRDFVVTGYQDSHPFRVQWSGINDATTWTFNVVTQSDFQDIPDSGVIQGITGGEYGIVFLEKAIVRMTYAGTPLIFQFDKITNNLGCLEPNSIVQYQSSVFFLSDDGFYMCDGQTVKGIGAEKVDRFFLDDFNDEYGYLMSATVDPLRNLVIWAYPSTRGDGAVDSLIIYNFATGKWSTATTDVNFVGLSQTPGLTLEGLDQISASIDALETSLDSRLFIGGKFVLGGGRGGKIISFTDFGNTATLQTGDIEAENRFSNLRLVRPIVDGGTANVALASRASLKDAVSYGSYVSPTSEDRVSVRGVGRYHRLSMQPTGTWETIIGADIEFTPLGGR